MQAQEPVVERSERVESTPMIWLLFGCAAIAGAAFAVTFRRELVQARVRAVEQSKWLRGSAFSGEQSNQALVWLAAALFAVVGLTFVAVGLSELL